VTLGLGGDVMRLWEAFKEDEDLLSDWYEGYVGA